MTRTPYWTLWKSFGCDVSDKSAVFSRSTLIPSFLSILRSTDGAQFRSPFFGRGVESWMRGRGAISRGGFQFVGAALKPGEERNVACSFDDFWLRETNRQGETIFWGIVRAEAYRTITASIVRVFDVDFAHDAISSNLSKYVETRYICTSRTETMIQRCRMLQWIAEVA